MSLISFALIALQRLDPFDFRAFGSFAQGDCSWEGFFTKIPRETVTLSEDGGARRNRRSRTGITSIGQVLTNKIISFTN